MRLAPGTTDLVSFKRGGRGGDALVGAVRRQAGHCLYHPLVDSLMTG